MSFATIHFVNHGHDGDGLCLIKLRIIAGEISAVGKGYFYLDELQAFAAQLSAFPENLNDAVELVLGNKPEHDYGFLQIKVCCYDAVGHVAFSVELYSPKEWQTNQLVQFASHFSFTLPTEVSAINKLGADLNTWVKRDGVEFEHQLYLRE